MHLFRPTLKRVNTGLFLTIILVDAYIVLFPFLPGIFARPASATSSQTTNYSHQLHPTQAPKQSQANQVIIPSMQLDQPIHEGRDTYTELAKGVWHWPDSSTPDKGSNTVLLGHRFTYTNPRGVFYFLDTVKVGDEIGLVWNNTTYLYRVYQVEVVSPSHTEILSPTAQPTLTIYTCTPTWWPVNRLVVLSHPEKTP